MNVQDDLFGETPLHKALTRQMHDSVLCLLAYGASVNTRDARADTAIHTAAKHCRVIAVWTALFKARPTIAVSKRIGWLDSTLHFFQCC